MTQGKVIVADLGKTQLRFAEAVGSRLSEIDKVPAPAGGPDFWDETVASVMDYVSERRVAVLKLAVAGAVQGGHVESPRLRGVFFPLGPVLSERLGVRVAVVNDLEATALGELHAGAGKGTREAILITVSTGINAVAIKGGVVLPNPTKVTEEYGHQEMPKQLRDPAISSDPGCGRICWESHISGSAVYDRAAARGLEFKEKRDFDRLAAAGNSVALELYEDEGRLLAEWLALILSERPAPVVILHGTFARRGFEFFEWPLREHLSALVGKVPQLRVGELGDDAGLIGATYLR